MAQLEIYITTEGNNTVSQYYVSKSQHVTFYNEADKIATIVVKDPVGTDVLCDNNGKVANEFPVPAKDSKGDPGNVKMFICKDYEGKTFKYSAEIEGTIKEDPIVIIGRDKAGPGPAYNLADLGLGLLGGIVLTLVALRLFRKQRPT